jgi:hypothetical protein
LQKFVAWWLQVENDFVQLFVIGDSLVLGEILIQRSVLTPALPLNFYTHLLCFTMTSWTVHSPVVARPLLMKFLLINIE